MLRYSSTSSAFVVASLTALLASSCGSAGIGLLPDVVLAAWAGIHLLLILSWRCWEHQAQNRVVLALSGGCSVRQLLLSIVAIPLLGHFECCQLHTKIPCKQLMCRLNDKNNYSLTNMCKRQFSFRCEGYAQHCGVLLV